MTTPVQKPKGFFHLQRPSALVDKMHYHTLQLKSYPLDTYAAFDFFVTAHHLPDWLAQFCCAATTHDARGQALTKICGQLANGAKRSRNRYIDAGYFRTRTFRCDVFRRP